MKDIILTFFLTTVVGGLLGSFFQKRTWDHQNRTKLYESERLQATKIFEEISSLLDKRLYRMRQLNWKLNASNSDDEVIEEHMINYRNILFDWNDNLNRNLALTQMYFGQKIRRYLENTVYEEFQRFGSIIEKYYMARKNNEDKLDRQTDKLDLNILRDHMYRLNVMMITAIQTGNVGSSCKDIGEDINTPLYHFGYKGTEIKWIQARLKVLGCFNESIDGCFDSKTEKAVKLLQKKYGLDIDGKVGPQTQKVLFYHESD